MSDMGKDDDESTRIAVYHNKNIGDKALQAEVFKFARESYVPAIASLIKTEWPHFKIRIEYEPATEHDAAEVAVIEAADVADSMIRATRRVLDDLNRAIENPTQFFLQIFDWEFWWYDETYAREAQAEAEAEDADDEGFFS